MSSSPVKALDSVHPMLHRVDFVLVGGDGRYEAHVPDRWTFDGRAFGGFTSALALASMFEHTGRDVAASLSVTFLEPGAEGSLVVEVETLRSGRTAAAVAATVRQDGRPILTANAWLADGWLEQPDATVTEVLSRYGGERPPPPPPVESASLEWLHPEWPALQFAERRGIDYPTSWATFARGRPEVALWLRVQEGDHDGDPLAHPQLGDVLHADAHLFDAPGQVTGFEDALLLSLDLNIAWQPGAHEIPSTDWRLYEGRGSVAAGGVTAVGTLRSEAGALLAVTTSQGLLRHR